MRHWGCIRIKRRAKNAASKELDSIIGEETREWIIENLEQTLEGCMSDAIGSYHKVHRLRSEQH